MKQQRKRWVKYRPYWETTYRDLNPFLGAIRCPECKQAPTRERIPPDWPPRYCGAVSIHHFKCANGHRWTVQKIHD